MIGILKSILDNGLNISRFRVLNYLAVSVNALDLVVHRGNIIWIHAKRVFVKFVNLAVDVQVGTLKRLICMSWLCLQRWISFIIIILLFTA